MTVRPLEAPSIASCTSRSDSESRADVASSSSSTRGSASRARAMATRCFCPPDSLTPRSPTSVAYPSERPPTNSCALARRHASSTRARTAASLKSTRPPPSRARAADKE
mmetsp:Transcript_6667/g.21364  ORF Transcript_6667/g.21364 Transcript_6667/m.21364 type:complete len:109 (-) Transcript_6667:1547-1873(-)